MINLHGARYRALVNLRSLALFLPGAPKPAATRFADYTAQGTYRLPFDGEWYVFWGGRSLSENRHAIARDQRFAYDFLQIRAGRSARGTRQQNSDHYCFGAQILAPMAGVVKTAVDGLPDNVPGLMDVEHPLGNHVVLDHGSDEFSFLCHLRQGSVRCTTGVVIASGEQIAECGNSGYSTEPHLHYHLQNTASPFRGEGLPVQFVEYAADGIRVECGNPHKGQTICQQEAAGGLASNCN